MGKMDDPGRRRHAAFNKKMQRMAEDYFKAKGARVSRNRPYSLRSRDDWHENIILSRVAEYVESLRARRSEKRKRFALHNSVHHGRSSQAFSWNLLGPLIVDEQWHIVDEILERAGINLEEGIAGAELEWEEPAVFNEDGRQPTSIDFRFLSRQNKAVYVEFKFTEPEFGGCSVFQSGDCDGRNPAANFSLCYLHRLGRRYWELAEKHGLLMGQTKSDSQCPFSTLYQAYRLILFALEKGGHFLLIYDCRNPAFVAGYDGIQRGLFVRVMESLPQEARERCHALSVQSVLAVLEKYSSELDWLDELREKYFKA